MKLTGLKSNLDRLKSFLHKDHIIGLDLGSSSVKLAELVRKDDGLVLIRLQSKEGAPSEPALRDLLKGVDQRKSKFIVSVNCPQTAMRVIETPPMPKGELKEAVRLESKNYFPFPVDQSQVEFEELGQAVGGGTKRIQLAVAVSPRQTVNTCLSLLRQAGVRPDALVSVPWALLQLAANSSVNENEIQCLADIGERQTELVILKGRRLIFSRKIPVGGWDFTQALRVALVSDRGRIELSDAEAEEIKREVGIPAESPSSVVHDKITTAQLTSMLRLPLEQWVSEIERCFDYYREETRGEKVDSLVLVGRGARLKGLSRYLAENLGIEVKIGNPLERLKMEAQLVQSEEGFSEFAVALGAALSSGGGINLLPPEIKEETQQAFKRATIQSAASAAILISAFLYIGMRIELANLQKRTAVAKLELAGLETELGEATTVNLANQVLSDEPYWEDVFKELSHVIPSDIYLTKLGMAAKRLVMRGRIVSKEKEGVLSNFIFDLEKGIFNNVKLVTSKTTGDKSASEFELNSWIDGSH